MRPKHLAGAYAWTIKCPTQDAAAATLSSTVRTHKSFRAVREFSARDFPSGRGAQLTQRRTESAGQLCTLKAPVEQAPEISRKSSQRPGAAPSRG